VAEAPKLAELEPPPDLEASVRSLIRHAVSGAYVGTFRRIAIVCAALSVISGAIAWFTLGHITRSTRPAA
jgi:hypothetical protein